MPILQLDLPYEAGDQNATARVAGDSDLAEKARLETAQARGGQHSQRNSAPGLTLSFTARQGRSRADAAITWPPPLAVILID